MEVRHGRNCGAPAHGIGVFLAGERLGHGHGVCLAAGLVAIRGLVTVAGVLYGRAARPRSVGVFLAG